MSELFSIIASFTAPENIGTTPFSLLWMFPLLGSVAIIYKATKMRVIFSVKFVREVLVLFVSISVFMVLVAVALHVVVWFLTG